MKTALIGMTVGLDMKNPYIIPAAMICAAILGGFWILKPANEQPQKVISERPQKVIVVQPPPDISIFDAAKDGNIKAVKQHITAGTDVNAKNKDGDTPLDEAISKTADLLRKHGGKTGGELKAEGK